MSCTFYLMVSNLLVRVNKWIIPLPCYSYISASCIYKCLSTSVLTSPSRDVDSYYLVKLHKRIVNFTFIETNYYKLKGNSKN